MRIAESGASQPDWLDDALRTALPPPTLPVGFKSRVAAAIQRLDASSTQAARRSLADEHARQAAGLHSDYVKLQRGTLGQLIGAGFVTGIAVTMALPWLRARLGDWTPAAPAAVGVALAIVLGMQTWYRRRDFSR
jgi:hypothetical protein